MNKNITSFSPYIFLFSSLLFLSGCIHRKQIDKQKLIVETSAPHKALTDLPERPPITIWVHGTLMFRTPIYHRIFNNRSYLVPITSLPADHHFRELATTITEHDPENFPLEEFYVFSWSGRLQNQERKQAAEKLYHEIVRITEEYQQKYGCQPTIQIITHSHGGNLVLNMSKIKNNITGINIKSLILLACPVQEKTMHLIASPMFQRVYSLYSSLDMIQILAPQFRRRCIINEHGLKHKHHYKIPPFSARLFPHYNNLIQAKIKIDNYPLSHTRFSHKEFVALLPAILRKLDAWHAGTLPDAIGTRKLLCVYKI